MQVLPLPDSLANEMLHAAIQTRSSVCVVVDKPRTRTHVVAAVVAANERLGTCDFMTDRDGG